MKLRILRKQKAQRANSEKEEDKKFSHSNAHGGFKAKILAGKPSEDVLKSFLSRQASHPGGSTWGEAFDYSPRQFAKRLANIPSLNFPLSSCSDNARSFFNQGMAQIYAYMTVESERSFRQAYFEDNNCLMALWGMSLSQVTFGSGNWYRGQKIILLTKRLLEHEKIALSDLEESLIEALYQLYFAPKNSKKIFVQSLHNLAQESNETELKALTVNFIWQYNLFEELDTSKDEMDQWIREILERSPFHPIHHQRIHMWNDGENEKRCRENAYKISTSMKDAAHMWHMASHIYFNIGQLPDADQHFEAAQRLDHKYALEQKDFPYFIHNYAHNSWFWFKNLSYQGALKAAERIALDLVALPLHPLYNDPQNFSDNQHAPYIQGLYGFADVLFQTGNTQLIREWYKKGYFEDILKSPHRSATYALRFQSILIYALREHNPNALAAKRIEKILKDWPLRSEKEKEIQEEALSFLKDQKKYLHQKTLENLDALKEHEFTPDRVYLKELRHLGLDFKIIELLSNDTYKRNTLKGALFLAEAYWNTDAKGSAQEYFSIAQEKAMKMDTEHPLYGLGADLNRKINGASFHQDWRKTDTLYHDSRLFQHEKRGPLEFPGLFIKSFKALDSSEEEKSFEELLGTKKQALMLFVLGGGCLGCNEQIQSLLEDSDQFSETQVIVVSTDPAKELSSYKEMFPELDEKNFKFISSEDYKLFKEFRVYDDFEKVPLHGSFVINSEKEILWLDRSSHPFKEWKWLSKELKRLNKARNWKEGALSYKDFPLDLRGL